MMTFESVMSEISQTPHVRACVDALLVGIKLTNIVKRTKDEIQQRMGSRFNSTEKAFQQYLDRCFVLKKKSEYESYDDFKAARQKRQKEKFVKHIKDVICACASNNFIYPIGNRSHAIGMYVSLSKGYLLLCNTGLGVDRHGGSREYDGKTLYEVTRKYECVDKELLLRAVAELMYYHGAIHQWWDYPDDDGHLHDMKEWYEWLKKQWIGRKWNVPLFPREHGFGQQTAATRVLPEFENAHFHPNRWRLEHDVDGTARLYARAQFVGTCTYSSILWLMFALMPTSNDAIELEDSLRRQTLQMVKLSDAGDDNPCQVEVARLLLYQYPQFHERKDIKQFCLHTPRRLICKKSSSSTRWGYPTFYEAGREDFMEPIDTLLQRIYEETYYRLDPLMYDLKKLSDELGQEKMNTISKKQMAAVVFVRAAQHVAGLELQEAPKTDAPDALVLMTMHATVTIMYLVALWGAQLNNFSMCYHPKYATRHTGVMDPYVDVMFLCEQLMCKMLALNDRLSEQNALQAPAGDTFSVPEDGELNLLTTTYRRTMSPLSTKQQIIRYMPYLLTLHDTREEPDSDKDNKKRIDMWKNVFEKYRDREFNDEECFPPHFQKKQRFCDAFRAYTSGMVGTAGRFGIFEIIDTKGRVFKGEDSEKQEEYGFSSCDALGIMLSKSTAARCIVSSLMLLAFHVSEDHRTSFHLSRIISIHRFGVRIKLDFSQLGNETSLHKLWGKNSKSNRHWPPRHDAARKALVDVLESWQDGVPITIAADNTIGMIADFMMVETGMYKEGDWTPSLYANDVWELGKFDPNIAEISWNTQLTELDRWGRGMVRIVTADGVMQQIGTAVSDQALCLWSMLCLQLATYMNPDVRRRVVEMLARSGGDETRPVSQRVLIKSTHDGLAEEALFTSADDVTQYLDWLDQQSDLYARFNPTHRVVTAADDQNNNEEAYAYLGTRLIWNTMARIPSLAQVIVARAMDHTVLCQRHDKKPMIHPMKTVNHNSYRVEGYTVEKGKLTNVFSINGNLLWTYDPNGRLYNKETGSVLFGAELVRMYEPKHDAVAYVLSKIDQYDIWKLPDSPNCFIIDTPEAQFRLETHDSSAAVPEPELKLGAIKRPTESDEESDDQERQRKEDDPEEVDPGEADATRRDRVWVRTSPTAEELEVMPYEEVPELAREWCTMYGRYVLCLPIWPRDNATMPGVLLIHEPYDMKLGKTIFDEDEEVADKNTIRRPASCLYFDLSYDGTAPTFRSMCDRVKLFILCSSEGKSRCTCQLWWGVNTAYHTMKHDIDDEDLVVVNTMMENDWLGTGWRFHLLSSRPGLQVSSSPMNVRELPKAVDTRIGGRQIAQSVQSQAHANGCSIELSRLHHQLEELRTCTYPENFGSGSQQRNLASLRLSPDCECDHHSHVVLSEQIAKRHDVATETAEKKAEKYDISDFVAEWTSTLDGFSVCNSKACVANLKEHAEIIQAELREIHAGIHSRSCEDTGFTLCDRTHHRATWLQTMLIIYHQFIGKNTPPMTVFNVCRRIHPRFVRNIEERREAEDTLMETSIGKFIDRKQHDLLYKPKSGMLASMRFRHPRIYQAIMGMGKSAIIVPRLVLEYLTHPRIGDDAQSLNHVVVVQPDHLVTAALRILHGLFVTMPWLNVLLLSDIYQFEEQSRKHDTPAVENVVKVLVVSDKQLKQHYLKEIMDSSTLFADERFAVIYDEIDASYDPMKSCLNVPCLDSAISHPLLEEHQMNQYYHLIWELATDITLTTDDKRMKQIYHKYSTFETRFIDKILRDAQDVHRMKLNCDYGYYEGNMLAVPYEYSNTPLKDSNFSDPDVTALMTCLLKSSEDAQGGFRTTDKKEIRHYFDLMVRTMGKQLTRSLLASVIPHADRDAEYDMQSLLYSDAWDDWDRRGTLMEFYACSILLKKYLVVHNMQYNTSFIDLMSGAFSRDKVAFSGTTDMDIPEFVEAGESRVGQFATTVESCIFSVQSIRATILRTLSITTSLEPDGQEERDEYHQLWELLQQKEGDKLTFQCLIDSAASLRYFSTVEIFEKLKLPSTTTFVAFLSEYGDRAMHVTRRAVEPGGIPSYDYTPYTRMEPGRHYFYYYDQQHSRGTDLLLPADTVGLVVVDTDSQLDDVAQACYRLRQLHYGQHVCFFVNQLTTPVSGESEHAWTPETLYQMLKDNSDKRRFAKRKLHYLQNYKAVKRNSSHHNPKSYLEATYYRLSTKTQRKKSLAKPYTALETALWGKYESLKRPHSVEESAESLHMAQSTEQVMEQVKKTEIAQEQDTVALPVSCFKKTQEIIDKFRPIWTTTTTRVRSIPVNLKVLRSHDLHLKMHLINTWHYLPNEGYVLKFAKFNLRMSPMFLNDVSVRQGKEDAWKRSWDHTLRDRKYIVGGEEDDMLLLITWPEVLALPDASHLNVYNDGGVDWISGHQVSTDVMLIARFFAGGNLSLPEQSRVCRYVYKNGKCQPFLELMQCLGIIKLVHPEMLLLTVLRNACKKHDVVSIKDIDEKACAKCVLDLLREFEKLVCKKPLEDFAFQLFSIKSMSPELVSVIENYRYKLHSEARQIRQLEETQATKKSTTKTTTNPRRALQEYRQRLRPGAEIIKRMSGITRADLVAGVMSNLSQAIARECSDATKYWSSALSSVLKLGGLGTSSMSSIPLDAEQLRVLTTQRALQSLQGDHDDEDIHFWVSAAIAIAAREHDER